MLHKYGEKTNIKQCQLPIYPYPWWHRALFDLLSTLQPVADWSITGVWPSNQKKISSFCQKTWFYKLGSISSKTMEPDFHFRYKCLNGAKFKFHLHQGKSTIFPYWKRWFQGIQPNMQVQWFHRVEFIKNSTNGEISFVPIEFYAHWAICAT